MRVPTNTRPFAMVGGANFETEPSMSVGFASLDQSSRVMSCASKAWSTPAPALLARPAARPLAAHRPEDRRARDVRRSDETASAPPG